MTFFLRISTLAFLTITVLLSSCASFLNGSKQQVKLRTGSEDAKVYVEGEKVGEGRSISLTLKRDKKPKHVRVEADGYKPQNEALVQTNRPFLYWLSWFPFGPPSIFLIPAGDNGPKAYDYNDQYVIRNKTPFPDREENQKFLFLDDLTFSVKQDDLNFAYYDDYDDFKGKQDPSRTFEPEEGVEYTDEDGQDVMNIILNRHNFIDTSEGVFRDKANTVNLEAEIRELDVHYCFPFMDMAEGVDKVYPMKADSRIHFELQSIYDDQLYEETFRTTSGTFTAKKIGEEVMGSMIKDVIYEAMADFLQRSEVQKHMKREERKKPDYDQLTLQLGQSIEGLNEAQKATVTIETGDDGHGSGCVIGRNGYIVTNYHVVASDKENLQVRLNNGMKMDAKLVRKNVYSDLALLKVDNEFEKTYTIPKDKSYEAGMTAYAIGTPESVELGQTLTKGIISGVRDHEGDTYLQSDVSVNPGSSGGALVNEKGYFVGVVSSKIMGYANEGISFSMPAHLVDDRLGVQYEGD